MKERSVSRRNFVSAFEGGVLGILALGYLHPIALPFGCFFGVVVGWWYQEIWQSVTDSFRRGVAGTQHAWNRLTTFVLTPTRKLKEVRFDIGPYLKVFHFFVFAFVWVLRRPIVFIQWLLAHPVNRAYATRTLAVLTHLALNALWVVPLVVYCFKATNSAPNGSAMPLLYVMGGCILVPMLAMLVPPMRAFDFDEEIPKMRKFYLVWERYAASGPLRFFAKDLANLFLWEIFISLFAGGMLIWFTGIGGAFLLLVVAPISAMVGAIKGIYEVSMRAGHWLCFGTTVTVTALAAWVAHPYLNDARVLWTVALFAGLGSAVATEGLRRSLVWFFSISERAQAMVSVTLGAQLAPSGRAFWRITTSVSDRFCNALPMSV